MFQLKDILAAHGKVKSGADFPAYVQDLIKLGVVRYDTFVQDGRVVYHGINNYHLEAEPKYATLAVADHSNLEVFARNLKIHQQGQTDYPTFCRHAAEAGVHKWSVDLRKMTCTYFDKANDHLITEPITGM